MPAKKPRLADKADRHALYQRAVQTPRADVAFFERAFRELRGRRPVALREDFCGTAYLSTTWCKSARDRTAIGVDLDGPTLEWGRRHNVARAGSAVAKRVRLVQGDVLDTRARKVDIVCAMNFSYWVFKTRELLRRYFVEARAACRRDGLLVLEVYGGTECVVPVIDRRDVGDFEYRWEQELFDPVTHRTLCHIHFRFRDRSRIDRAFTYDWRMWSIPELRELLEEAGFRRSHVYWEQVDEDGDGTGEYRRVEGAENQEAWVVYLVAEA
jgi:hypothetical protein